MKLTNILRFLRSRWSKSDSYEIRGDEILRGRGSGPENRLLISELTAWRIYPEMVFDVVEMTLADGRQVVWLDTHDDLIGILRRVAGHREKPTG